MTGYAYRAAQPNGAIVRGTIEASSVSDAMARLSTQALSPIAVEPSATTPRRRLVGRRQLAIVFRSISSLVTAGVPLERALAASEDLTEARLREALVHARSELRNGRSLGEALGGSSSVVPPVVSGIIRAGERGSQLQSALEEVADQLEREADLLGHIRQALAYPLLLAVAGSASVIVIGTVVVPKFAQLLADLGQQLPPATRLLLGMSSLLSHYGLGLFAVLLVAGVMGVRWRTSASGRRASDSVMLRMPILGRIRLGLASARIGRALGTMLKAGMPLLPALTGAAEACGDVAVSERLARARERVAQGEPLAPSLRTEAVLVPSAVHLIAVGESSGQLGIMAQRAGDLAAQEAERSLKTMVGLMEPALVVFFGGLVAWVAAALLQAVYSVRP